MQRKIIIDRNFDNYRIDKVVQTQFPELSLRACRRMICSKQILLNSLQAMPGKRVKYGDKIDILVQHSFAPLLSEPPYLLKEDENFYFVHKPKNLHSVALAGGYNKSLEDFLDSICPDYSNNKLSMLQRLDYGTSGIISIAKSESALQAFRRAEKDSKCSKFYIALLDGRLENQCTVRNSLDVNNKKKTAVLKTFEEDSGRWTKFFPLVNFDKNQTKKILPTINKELDLQDSQELTLAGCEIMRGARHQIRAHAASIGSPLLGDGLYGKSGNSFFLHHGAMITPYFKIISPPAWHLPSKVGMIIFDWLKSQLENF